MTPQIVNHRIAGSRSNVWDVLHYLESGFPKPEIAEILSISAAEVDAAVRHIEENKAYVMEVHRQIEERNARGNPPEVVEKLKATRVRMQARLESRRQAQAEDRNGAGHSQ